MSEYINNIFIILFLIVLIRIRNNREKDFIIKMKTHKLFNYKYITSVQYVDYEKKIKVIIYSKTKIKFSKCIIKYTIYYEKCNPKLVYHGGFHIFNIYDINTSYNQKPTLIIINNLSINIPPSNRNTKYDIVLCYAVMSNFNRLKMLLQSIEAVKYFGISKVIFYLHSASVNVMNILRYYQSIGLADIYKYDSDDYLRQKESNSRKYSEIYHLIYFKMNHCFNEYKTKRNHMLFLDLDEILWLSEEKKNYKEMINSIDDREFYFLNAFFFKPNFNIPEMNDKNESIALPDINIFSISNYCPIKNGYVHKYIIINTSSFLAVEIHDSVSRNSVTKEFLSSNIAYIRHTRLFNYFLVKNCPKSAFKQKKKTRIERIIEKRSEKIMKNLL